MADGGPPNWICVDGSQSECGVTETRVVQSVSSASVALRLQVGTAARVSQPWKQYLAIARRYGPGPHRAPWHTLIHQVPLGKHALRSPAVHAASARAYCALNTRKRFTASVAAPRCPAAENCGFRLPNTS